jgi:hypothetical protein
MDYSLLIGVHNLKKSLSNFSNIRSIDENNLELLKVSENGEPMVNLEFFEFYQKNNTHVYISTDQTKIFLFGIIDILQTFNLKKKMERLYKQYILQFKKEGITVQPPVFYQERFLNKMIEIFKQ